MPKEGEKAPAFSAKDETGKTHKLSDYKGKPLVLFFYPKDDTSGCTKEACSVRDSHANIVKKNAVVLGISRDDDKTHLKFKQKYDLNFPLLIDDGSMSEAYGTWVEKNMYGRKYMGMARATFLIGPDGTVAKVWPKVTPEGHGKEIEEALRAVAIH